MPTPPEDLEARRRAANPPKAPHAELLDSGQEEVFSRTEAELGRIEHNARAGRHETGDNPSPDLVRRDEAQTERQAPDSASPGEAAAGS